MISAVFVSARFKPRLIEEEMIPTTGNLHFAHLFPTVFFSTWKLLEFSIVLLVSHLKEPKLKGVRGILLMSAGYDNGIALEGCT